MNKLIGRLPREIQKEIYEFARGDRKHWKSKFNDVIMFFPTFCVNGVEYLRSSQRKGNCTRFKLTSVREVGINFLTQYRQWVVFIHSNEWGSWAASDVELHASVSNAMRDFINRCQSYISPHNYYE